MEDWKDRFWSEILARGRDYCDRGCVGPLEVSDTAIHAQVQGSRSYQVDIQKDGTRVTGMHCDCPYAEGGKSCKHMAAVLYKWSEKLPVKSAEPNWRGALELLSAAQMRRLIASFAQGDRFLQECVVHMLSEPEELPNRWTAELENILYKYVDDYDFLDYEDAYDCMTEFTDYLQENLALLLENEQVEDAVALITAVYGEAFGQEMDDSDGGLSMLSASCWEGMRQVLAQCDAQQEREAFDRLCALWKSGSDWAYGTDGLESMMVQLDWSEEIEQSLLHWLDEEPNDHRMTLRANLMKKLGATEAELIAWWEQRRESQAAYRALLSLYEENDPPKAIELVRERRAQAQDTWEVSAYTKTLLTLLEKAGERAQYERELKALVLEQKCTDEKYVLRLKKITPPEQWTWIFERIVKNTEYASLRMQLYHMEGMHERLLAELESTPLAADFLRYEEELRHWAPERMLALFVERLKQQMNGASDRAAYREIIARLRGLDAYPDGRMQAKQLAAYWYAKHKNRPAMKSELRNAGYTEE